MSDNKYTPPVETRGDHAHTLVRAGLSLIPQFDGLAVEIFSAVIAPPLKKRQQDWMNAIAAGLRECERKQQCVVDDLKENDSFLDTVMQASQAAIRTSQQEKFEALRNAVLNSAMPSAPDEARRLLFVNFVDEFSALHLKILKLLDDPTKVFEDKKLPKHVKMETLFSVVSKVFPDLASQEPICERICQDLNNSGLLIANSLRRPMHRFPYFPDRPREEQLGYRFADELPRDNVTAYSGSPTPLRHWTTELGREFLQFITAPD